jgi:hypothetical protein
VSRRTSRTSRRRDDVAETNPLAVPTLATDTSTTTDNDAQAQLEVPKVSIGDYVWWDVDRDGTQNDDKPAAGVTVNLLLNGAQVATTTTTRRVLLVHRPAAQHAVHGEVHRSGRRDVHDAERDGATDNSPSTDLTDSDANPPTAP